MKIALDGMGGDHAPQNVVAGAVAALAESKQITKLYLTGDETLLKDELDKHRCHDPRIEIVHTTEVIEMGDHAVLAVRRKKDSSLCRAVDLVKRGDAEAIVSAGNTGAMVAATTIKLRTLEGVERPGIAAFLPTKHNVCVLIDAGANVDARPEHMLQYAIMGAVISEHVLGFDKPAIGLMSIGSEEAKGNEFTKEIFQYLKDTNLNFKGNIEGHSLFEDPVEVVLCNGFTGNVVLKTCEATATAVFNWLKSEIKSSPLRMAGAWLARDAFRAIRDKTNYEVYGGSPLVGVNGIAIIAHGSSTALAMKNAVHTACRYIEKRINPLIIEAIKEFNDGASI